MSIVVLKPVAGSPPQTSTQHENLEKEHVKSEKTAQTQSSVHRKHAPPETYLKGGCSKKNQCQAKDDCPSNPIRKHPILYLQQIKDSHQ